MLTKGHASAFEKATPTDVVTALFSGWTLCGSRRGAPDGSRHVFLLHHSTGWLGFGLFAEDIKPAPPTTPDPAAMVDYLALMRAHREHAPWHTLDGARRLERMRTALTLNTLDRPIRATTAVEFLEAADARCANSHRFAGANHIDYMCDILVTDDFADPDGTLAAARTLSGLGRYTHLVPAPNGEAACP